MAISLETLRSLVLTSIRGRRLGLDVNECLVGPKQLRPPITAATSATTGTDLTTYGYNTLVTTTNDTWRLPAPPYVGAEVTLMTGSSSTGIHTVAVSTASASVIYSSNGIAGQNVVLTGAGQAVKLVGLTTAIWAVAGRVGSSDYNSVSS